MTMSRFYSILFGVALAALSTPALAQNAPDVAQMFANFSSSSVALINLVVAAGFVIGLAISLKAALAFKEYAESGGRMQLKTPLGMMIVGVLLVALPGTINTATETLSLGSNTGTQLFSEGIGGGGVPGMDAAIKGVLLFIKLIGHIAIVRGFLIFKRAAEGQQGGEVGRALWHVLGGAAAVNINATIRILANTVGMPLPL